METLGRHKRDLLVERVEGGRKAQTQAKDQFQTAMEKFTELTDFQGGELEKIYKELNAEFQKSQAKAKTVSKYINQIEDVASDLFGEWESELDLYTNQSLRRASKSQLDRTRGKYQLLIDAMKRAETKIGPVLAAFGDHVLFLKHNLNAQAISSLQEELATIELNVASLIKEMEASIAEADEFIESMSKQSF
jgi:hypothetical protein